MKIKHVTNTDNRYKQLPFGTLRTIHELRLNRRKRGSRGGQRKIDVMITLDKPTWAELKNLRPLPYSSYKVTKHIGKRQSLLTNTQSIRNKEDIVSDYMRREAIDIAIATETWLTNNDRDVVWLESNGFVRDGYLISTSNRVGGGIAMIFRSNITATEIIQKKMRFFKLAHWMTTIGTGTLNILGIYHPPYSTGEKITNAVFLDDLMEFLRDWMASYRNIIMCGDFNLHINNPSDTKVKI